MKILLLAEFCPSFKSVAFTGGVEPRIYFNIKYFINKHHVIVISRRKHGQLDYFYKKSGSGSLTIKRIGPEILSTTATLPSFFSRFWFLVQSVFLGLKVDADIVEGSNYIVALPAFIIGILKRIPKVVWYPDVLIGKWYEHFGIMLGLIGEISERILLKLPWDQVITITEVVRQRLIKRGVKSDKIIVIPCGFDLNIDINVNKNMYQLIMISRLVKSKRVDWAIKLMSKLDNQYKLIIVGDGPMLDNLQRLIDKLSLQDRILFRSKLTNDQLNKLIAESILLIHPSIIEGFGRVLVESVIVNTPFVSADIPTAIEISQRLHCGVLFKQNNFTDLVQQTKHILCDKLLYKQMQKQSKQNLHKFDYKITAQTTENVYKKLYQNL